MAGHSKWSQIKRKKAKTDTQRGKVFSKMAKEIMVVTKLGGAEAESNPRLRLAIQKAKAANMPNDNINRAIQKGSGDATGAAIEEAYFEAYGPLGVAILIQCLTDNKNRTVSNLKIILNKNGARMVEKGSVSYLFEPKGFILFEPGSDEDRIIDIATHSDADDIDTKVDGSIEVVTSPAQLEPIKHAFDEQQIPYYDAIFSQLPSTYVQLPPGDADQLAILIDKLEDDDDVQEVFSNHDIID